MKKREGYAIIVKSIAQKRIKNNQCPSCGNPHHKWRRRTDWRCCSVDCTEKYWKEMVLVNGWSDLREKTFKRDNYTCAKCGLRPTKIETIVKSYDPVVIKKIKTNNPDPSKLIGDHITPIALGGDEWDIDNVQTLCKECNKIKTKLDAGKIAKQRRIEKLKAKGQKQLIE